MTQQVINTGLAPNDGTGAPLRTAFTETNVNFDQIWTAGPVGSNVRISDNRILTLNTNGNLTLAPNGTGRVVANMDVVPNLSNTRNLGSATQRWDTVYTQYLDITGELSLSSIEVDDLTVNGNLTVNGTTTTINTANLDVTDKLITIASGSPNAAVANGAGILVDGADATITYDHDNMSWVVNLPLVVDGNITATTFVGDLTGTADFANTANSVTAANVSGLSQVATSGSYTDLSNTPTDVSAFDNDAGYITESAIPTQVSAFENDANYITSAAIPTDVSAFENDSGYITESAIPTQVSAFENDANYITSAVANVISVNGATGVVSLEIPTATSDLSNDSGFITLAAIPTQVSAFENDSGYITESAIPTQVSAFENDANYITSAVANVISVNGATGVVSLEIPTATSDLSNDSGFITANVVGNLSATGNITGVYIKGNGSELTNLPAPSVAQDITSTGDMSIMTYDGNLKYVNNATVEPSTGSIKTAGNISATGNITGNYILGNGSQLTGLPATYGNANVATFMAGFGSNAISTTGNITAGYLFGNGSQLTGLPATYGNSNVATFLSAFGSNAISTTGNITASNFVGNISITGNVVGTSPNVTLMAGSYSTVFDNTGNLTLPGNTFAVNYANNTPVDVVTRFESSWTVPVGPSIQSFTVDQNNTYHMWVDCNIPQGILTWNATATVTNNNVPVVGVQYAWVYDGGGTPIDFISIPDQFVGTANTIVRSNTAPSATTNRFDFGINNASGRGQTVRYGWIKIS